MVWNSVSVSTLWIHSRIAVVRHMIVLLIIETVENNWWIWREVGKQNQVGWVWIIRVGHPDPTSTWNVITAIPSHLMMMVHQWRRWEDVSILLTMQVQHILWKFDTYVRTFIQYTTTLHTSSIEGLHDIRVSQKPYIQYSHEVCNKLGSHVSML